jgi:HAD superfamily hydrolase (TIGR01509 family)
MNKYRALIFDLFDTVAFLNVEKLPIFEWNGATSRSTTGALRTRYETQVRDIPFDNFVTALVDVLHEQQLLRAHDLREVPCIVRFTRTLVRAGLPDCHSTRCFAEELALAHCALLANATEIPPEYAGFLLRARTKYLLALVSNFDHAPTAREVLRKGAILEHFPHIVISVEHGWRKPHPKIFTATLAAMQVRPDEALFIGDSPDADVGGAKRVGLDVVWVNSDNNPLPPGIPEPDYIVPAITALDRILLE